MKKLRRLSLVSLLLVFTLMLSACSSEAKLFRAFEKQQSIVALETKTNYKFNVKTSELGEGIQAMVDEVTKVINEGELSLTQVTVGNEAKDTARGKVDISGKFAGQEATGSIWVDTKIKGKDNASLVQIFKFPKEFMDLLGQEFEGKEYMVYDFDELMKFQGDNTGVQPLDMGEIMEWAVDAQPKMMKFIEDYAKNFKLDLDLVKAKGRQEVGGEILDLYEITLDDKAFKEIVKYSGNLLLEDENLKEIFKEYFEIVLKAAGLPENEKADVKKGLSEMEEQLPELKKKFNELMTKIEPIQMIGNKGIKIELGLNGKGYIVSEKGYIDLVIDLENLTKANSFTTTNEEGKEEKHPIPATKGKINLGIEYDTKISNINDKNLRVEMPKTDAKNSVNFVDLMKLQNKQLEEIQKEMEAMEELEEGK